jgi:hypothetical protein
MGIRNGSSNCQRRIRRLRTPGLGGALGGCRTQRMAKMCSSCPGQPSSIGSLQEPLGSVTESADGPVFHKVPFLRHLPEVVAKVDLGFLKDEIHPTSPTFPIVNMARKRRVALFHKGGLLQIAAT